MRDFLKGLDLEKEVIDSIMTEYGKSIQGLKDEKESLTQKLNTYESEINTLKESTKENGDWKSKFEELDSKIKQQEAEEKARKEDEILTNAIMEVIGDKKFTNDYTKNGIISELKTEINKAENKGKGYSEIFEAITKDKTGIFENPNPPASIPGMGDTGSTNNAKEIPLIF